MDQIEVNFKVMVNIKVQVKLIVEVKFKDINAIVKIWNLGVPKTSDFIQIMINILNPNQDPPASSKAPNQDLKDKDVLCIF